MTPNRPIIVAVSGFSSNVGKSTLVCELLSRLSGWEAIKLTRGHYRSCGRDPQACCVSDLIGEEPIVRSGRSENYEAGKDTGRFWEAGAVNVHWVIANDEQVKPGVDEALSRVQTGGVIIEGNSFLEFVSPDLAIMCARAEGGTFKSSARRGLARTDVLYVTSLDLNGAEALVQFQQWRSSLSPDLSLKGIPLMTHDDIEKLVDRVTISRPPASAAR